MRARALLIETLVGIASAAVAAGAFCWMVKYTVLKEEDMIVIAAAVGLWVACKLLTWANRRNTHVFKFIMFSQITCKKKYKDNFNKF